MVLFEGHPAVAQWPAKVGHWERLGPRPQRLAELVWTRARCWFRALQDPNSGRHGVEDVTLQLAEELFACHSVAFVLLVAGPGENLHRLLIPVMLVFHPLPAEIGWTEERVLP